MCLGQSELASGEEFGSASERLAEKGSVNEASVE